MKRLRFLLFLLPAITLFSCTDVYFSEPQPAGVKTLFTFPEEVIGTWGSPEDGEVIVVTESDFTVDEGSEFEVHGKLNSNSILKRHRDQYYLSNLNSEKGYWSVVCFRIDQDSLQIYGFNSEDPAIELMIQKPFCKTFRNEDGSVSAVLLSPTTEELASLEAEGLLTKGSTLGRVH